MAGYAPELIPGTNEKRRKQIIVNINVDELEIFDEVVAQKGISRSEAIRRLMRRVVRHG